MGAIRMMKHVTDLESFSLSADSRRRHFWPCLFHRGPSSMEPGAGGARAHPFATPHTPGKWSSPVVSDAYSPLCPVCKVSDDSPLHAIKRQCLAAGGESCYKPRWSLAVGSVGGDIRGLMQILGLAGSAGTYFCMFCLGTLNETLMAGVPQLRTLPEPWASQDTRAPDVICPRMRPSTSEMARQAELYAAAVAEKPGISSAAWYNCIAKPLVSGTNMLQLLGGVPLHCSLGVGLILVNKVEEKVKQFDRIVLHEAAEASSEPTIKKAIADKFDLEIAIGDAEAELEEVRTAVADAEGKMEWAKSMEPGVEKRKGKAKAVGDQNRQE